MSLRADQEALVFFGAVAVLGAGVRVVRAAGGPAQASSQPALDRQIRSSDSALQSSRSAKKRTARSTSARKPARAAAAALCSASSDTMPDVQLNTISPNEAASAKVP